MKPPFALRIAVVVCTLVFPFSAGAATANFRMLVDADGDVATGCAVAGMLGVDQVLITRVSTDGGPARVTGTSRQKCDGIGLVEVEQGVAGWPAGYDASTGNVLVETRFAAAMFGGPVPTAMRIGVQAVSDVATHTVVSGNGDAPVYFPEISTHRRTAGSSGSERTIVLDGAGDDWSDLDPVFDGIEASGPPALRMRRVFAYAARANDEFLWFRFDATFATGAPSADDDTYTRPAASGLTVRAPGVLANDDDPNGLPLSAMPLSTPAHGSVTLRSDGSFTYTPADPTSDAVDSFQYKASNGSTESSPARVTIRVASAANANPVAAGDAYSGAEDTAVELVAPGVLQNDSDPDDDALVAALVDAPQHGTVVLHADGGFTYQPAADWSGSDSFTYSASDGTLSATATVTIEIAAVNDAPTVTPQSLTGDEDAPVSIALAASDVDGDTLTFSTTAPSHGRLSGAAPDLTYVPDRDFNGTDSFSFTASDGVATSTASVSLTIDAVNDRPVAGAQSIAATEDTPLPITLTATDVEGDPLTWRVTSLPCCGVLSGTAPDLVYTPNRDFTGADTLTFVASDGQQSSAPASVHIDVAAVDDAAFADDQTLTTAEDSAIAITLTGGDADGPVSFSAGTPSHGTLTGTAPDLIYTPGADFHGTDSFTFTVANTLPVSGTVTIEVTPVNDAPIAADQTVVVTEDAAAATVLNAGDVDGDALTWCIVQSPAHGSLSGTAPELTYTPFADYEGPDSFTFVANDGTVDSNAGTFTIQVTNVNDAPVITSASTFTTPENTPSAAFAVTFSDADAGDSSSFTISGGADAARFSIDADGMLRFVAVPDFEAHADADANDVYEVEVRVEDAAGASDAQLVHVTVTDGPDAPAFTSAPLLAATEDSPYAYAVSAADQDAGAALTITASTLPSWLTLTDHGDGTASLSGLPLGAHVGTHSVALVVSDGTSSSTQTFDIVVGAVNDAPVITSPATRTTAENAQPDWSLSADDEDRDALTWSISGGADAALFAIDAAGVFRFLAAPDFEAPADADRDNVYELQVQVSDGTVSVSGGVTVTVTNVNEAPVFTSAASAAVPENTVAVTTVHAVDPESDPVTYSLLGTPDDAFFAIDADTGEVRFLAPMSFESPMDEDGDNVYRLSVGAADAASTSVQTLEVSVVDVNDAPAVSAGVLRVKENSGNGAPVGTLSAVDEDADAITWAITGGDGVGVFSIDAATGVVRVADRLRLDYETAASFSLTVTATDDGVPAASTSIDVTVTVEDVNDAPILAHGFFLVPENSPEGTLVGTMTFTDQDPLQSHSFAIESGNELGVFVIDSAGNIFIAPGAVLDFENRVPFSLGIVVTDNGTPARTGTENAEVYITDVNEPPVFTTTSLSVVENTTTTTVLATDPEHSPLTYAITGGADAALFTIASSYGGLTFNVAPDFEAPGDADGDNVYLLEVTITSNIYSTTATIMVTVTDEDEAPVFPSLALTANENSIVAATAPAVDPESAAVTYSIIGGADAALFSIDASTGQLLFLAAPDYESPVDADGDNVYRVDLSATAGPASIASLSITVVNVNEAPSLAVTGGVTHTEGGGAVDVLLDATIGDVDGTTIASATVAITENLRNGADRLTFADTPQITGTYDSSIGELKLTGTATFAEYEAALRSIRFDNTADYQPVATRAITWTVNDGALDSAPQTTVVNMAGVNQPPEARALTSSTSTPEDTPKSWGYADIWFYDTELEGIFPYRAAKLSIVATHGTVTLGSTAGLDFSFAGAIGDGVDDAQMVVQGSIVDLRIAMAGLAFTPEADFNGPASISITIDDLGVDPGPALQDTVTIDVNVTPVNDPPSLVPGGDVTVDEDAGMYSATWATSMSPGPANESGQGVGINMGVTGTTGDLSFAWFPMIDPSDGTLRFQANANTCGTVSLRVQAQDNGGSPFDPSDDATSEFYTFTITVTCVNDSPLAADDVLSAVDEDSAPRTIPFSTLLGNDSNGGGETDQTLTIVSVDNATGGTAMISGTDVVFTLAPGFNGTAGFRYTAQDDGVPPATASANVTFAVNAVAEPPLVSDATTVEDTMSSAGLVISPDPSDGAGVTHYLITGITGGLLFQNDGFSLISSGDFITASQGAAGLRFMPLPDRNSAAGDAFGFTVQAALDAAGTGLGAGRNVLITVTEVNDEPFANADAYTAPGGGIIRIPIATLLANDTAGPANEASQSLEMVSVTAGAIGTVGISGTDVAFKPPFDFYGPMDFTYVVRDDGTTNGVPDPREATATVTVNVQ